MENALTSPRFKYIIWVIIILFTSAGIFAYFLYTSGKLPLLSKNVNSIFPYEKISFPNIVYPDDPSLDGRDIYYTVKNVQDLRFSGAGVYELNPGSMIPSSNGQYTITEKDNVTDYIVGTFVRWDAVPNSTDKYLVLEDKLGQGESKAVYPKIRVGFDTLEIDYVTKFATAIGVEDLSASVPEPQGQSRSPKLYKLFLVGSLTQVDLGKLIELGDALVITIKTNTEKNTDLEDENGAKIVSWVYIRRFDPQTSLPKELGRKIKLE